MTSREIDRRESCLDAITEREFLAACRELRRLAIRCGRHPSGQPYYVERITADGCRLRHTRVGEPQRELVCHLPQTGTMQLDAWMWSAEGCEPLTGPATRRYRFRRLRGSVLQYVEVTE